MLQIIRYSSRHIRTHTRYLQTSCPNYNGSTRVVPPPKSERQAAMRAEFLKLEEDWEDKVNYTKLTLREKLIHKKHNEAVKDFHFTYDDPDTGLKVITRLRHFLKGTCCGNACRHCIYNHQNVDKQFKEKKLFNTAFWIDNPNYVESEEEQFW